MRLVYKALLLLSILMFLPHLGHPAGDSDNSLIPALRNKSLHHHGVVVDSIVIDNHNIYDTDTEQYRHFIFKATNKLHYKTHRYVIKREVLFKVGEPFSTELAEETARNLRQRLPLYDAWIETEQLANGHLLVRVVTIDEWTLSGGLNISRDGNETKYSLGLAERNLLGNNQSLSLEYFVPSTEDNHAVARFTDRRFFGKPYAVAIGYGDNPLGRFRQVSVARPFYNLTQTSSFSFSIATTSGRRDIYSDSLVIAQSRYEGDLTLIAGSYRIGSYSRKIEFSSQYLYRYERVFDKVVTKEAKSVKDTSLARASFPVDSLYHQMGVSIRLSNLIFTKLTQIDGFAYTEDFVLGQAFQIGLARAFTSDFKDHVSNLFNIGFSQGYRVGSNLALLTYHRYFWFKRGKEIRRVTRLSSNYYNNALSFLTIAARGIYLSDRTSDVQTIEVGGGSDVRGYNKVFATGNRKGVFNFEGRFYPNVEILSVLFGGVLFVDLARSWKSNEPLRFRDFNTSVGVGLRIASERTSKNRLLRIDAAYSKKNGWQLSIGTNQYFNAQPSGFLLTTP